MRFAAIAAACAVLIAGCVYRIDIQQGNYVTQDQVQKLKTGMTRTEVRQALGTPLLMDVFHNDRWDYFFSQGKSGKEAERKQFSVYFKDDKVESFAGDVHPPAPPPVGAPRPEGLPQAGPREPPQDKPAASPPQPTRAPPSARQPPR
jgi:outer membrane protein assembly factor BamE